MAKKSFKNNPALHFITQPEEDGRPAAVLAKAPSKKSAAKKEAALKPASPPVKLNPLYVETKSKRVQLLMQPSLYEKLRQAAQAKEQSVNNLIHTVLGAWVEK